MGVRRPRRIGLQRRRAACRIAVLAIIGLVCFGCVKPHDFLMRGDAQTADVSYSGDLAAATAIARNHCARFERAARFVGSGIDVAYFDCVRR